MTRLYAGWAPGEALAFGYSLGLTASHSDVLDYRAMLARFHRSNFKTGKRGPEFAVRAELATGRSVREIIEGINGAPLA